MRYRKFEAEASVYERGNPATKLFIIISGQAALYAAGHEWEKGRELKDIRDGKARGRRSSKVHLPPPLTVVVTPARAPIPTQP